MPIAAAASRSLDGLCVEVQSVPIPVVACRDFSTPKATHESNLHKIPPEGLATVAQALVLRIILLELWSPGIRLHGSHVLSAVSDQSQIRFLGLGPVGSFNTKGRTGRDIGIDGWHGMNTERYNKERDGQSPLSTWAVGRSAT